MLDLNRCGLMTCAADERSRRGLTRERQQWKYDRKGDIRIGNAGINAGTI